MRIYARILLAFLGLWPLLGSCDRKPSVSRDKVQEAWDDYNNPALLDSGAVFKFSDLPLSGSALRIPWSDIYWPSHSGGIALRWRSGFQPPYNQTLPTEAQVMAMSVSELDTLSPAEKYDIFMGRFDFPTVQAELIRTHPSMPTWFGLCHGWASAAVNFSEPRQLLVKGATGVDLSFSSGDLKALLAYAQGVVYQPDVRALGQRCDVDLTTQPHLRNSASCRDTNAGSFHLILANLIGRGGQQVIADLSRGAEVWNFPIYGYSTREVTRRAPSVGAAITAASEVLVETEVEFIVEIDSPNVEPIGDSRAVASERVLYQYTVELDSFDRVVGGAWLSEERPDFLWIQERADFRGYYGNIESLYERSIRASSSVPMPSLTPTPTPAPIVTPLPEPDSGTGPLVPIITQPIPPVTPTPQSDAGSVPSATPTPHSGYGSVAPVSTPAPSAGSSQQLAAEPGSVSGSQGQPRQAGRCTSGELRKYGRFEMCLDDNKAIEPVTGEMLKLCSKLGFWGCNEPLLDAQLYLRLRGESFCPVGSLWSEKYAACVEGDMVLGPFGVAFELSCRSKGFGNLCGGLKIHAAYFDIVMRSI